MATCAERQRLVNDYEGAFDEYIQSLARGVQDRADNSERRQALLKCRATLQDHCVDHGCERQQGIGEGWWLLATFSRPT